MAKQFDIKAFIMSYIVCALWSSIDDDSQPMDDNYSDDDIAPRAMETMRSDCIDFVSSNQELLAEYCEKMKGEQWSGEERAGHDFWLTRNGHGAGFWDRGLGKLGEKLTQASKAYGSIDLYVTDDGKIDC